MFLYAAASFNVKQSELFTVDDLYKAQDLHKVFNILRFIIY
jgi:hypothetical protein